MSKWFHLDIGSIIAQLRKTRGFEPGTLRRPKQYLLSVGVKMSVNKIEFFKIMREQPVHEDARIDEVTNTNGTYTIRLNNPCNPNAALTNHRSWNNAQKAAAKYALWLEEFRTIEAAHAEALKMNESLDAEFARIDELAPDDDAKVVFKAIASKYEVGCVMGRAAAHAEALEINAQVNEELCKLARVIAGVNRSTYKHETKAQLIGAACAGVVDGLRERVGVVLSRDRLAETVTRAVVARNE